MRRGRTFAYIATVLGALRTAPAQGPPTIRSVIADTVRTTLYETGGLKVLHRISANSDIVVANLYLLGGVRQLTAENAGIEPLLLELSERGTRTYSKERLRRAMARAGTSIVTNVETDWTSFGIRATRGTFDSTWSVFASRVMQPTLDSSEFEIVRSQFRAGVGQRKDSPDALAEFLADSFAFAGHPYALSPSGTEASISKVTLAQLRRYHADQFIKSRMLLVVVGNVPKDKIEKLVSQTLAKLPAGNYEWTLPDTLPRTKAGVTVVERALPTNYILGRYAGPLANSKDYHALRIATAVLSGQLFGEVRSRRNLAYAVEAPFIDRAAAAGGLYVTTISPDVTLDVMRQQLNTLKSGLLDEDALERLSNQFITQYFLDNESNAEQADFLARAYLFQGDFTAVDHFAADLHAVRPMDVRRVAQRYMTDVRFVFIGDPRRVPTRTMERF
jgi:zinc protease